MRMIVALFDTEWNEAAAQPEAKNAYEDTQDPRKTTLALYHLRHAAKTAMVAVNNDWVGGPLIFAESFLTLLLNTCERLHHEHLLLRLLNHLLTRLMLHLTILLRYDGNHCHLLMILSRLLWHLVHDRLRYSNIWHLSAWVDHVCRIRRGQDVG